MILYFARERYGMRITKNDKGYHHDTGGRAVCIEASRAGQRQKRSILVFLP